MGIFINFVKRHMMKSGGNDFVKRENLKRKVVNDKAIIIAALFGGLIFGVIYGVEILNPCYTDWLLQRGDLTQHYLGWMAYRNSKWHFPIGMTDQLAYPELSSIIFTDSIPLFAVLFKILSPVLPETFQYFGLWGIISYMLQGAISAKILKKYLQSDIQTVLGSIFFILSFWVMQRMYVHTSLGGQWIILLALLLFVSRKNVSSIMQKVFWGGIAILAVSVHQYFVVMCGFICAGFALSAWIDSKKIKDVIILLFTYLFSAGIMCYLLGGFSSAQIKYTAGGLGYFSFNLNGFLNPRDFSAIVKAFPSGKGQYEGFAYLGAGIILLLIVTVCSMISRVTWSRLRQYVREKRAFLCGSILIFFLCIAFAVSPVITFGEKTIITIRLPGILTKIWSVFRSTGRMSWVSGYMLCFFAICADVKYCDKKFKTFLLTIALAIQVVDISDYAAKKQVQFFETCHYESSMKGENWEYIKNSEVVKHWYILTGMGVHEKYTVIYEALKEGISVNSFPFAHVPEDLMKQI